MAKRFRNRTSEEWRAVIRGLGFQWVNSNGDDEVYTHNKCDLAVLVPMRNEDIIMPTSIDMARKVEICLGIKKKDIIKWWKDNGFSE
jgi:predicted RNA binding protein YcfA (HicA-like mRNA interferase family)